MLKMKKSTEQIWPGHDHSTQLLIRWEAGQEGLSSAPLSSYRQDHPETRGGETVLSIPQLSIPFQTLSNFLYPSWLSALSCDSGFKSTYKEQLSSVYLLCDQRHYLDIIAAVSSACVQSPVLKLQGLLCCLPSGRQSGNLVFPRCWDHRQGICPCHVNLRNRHHKELVSSLVPERSPCTGV